MNIPFTTDWPLPDGELFPSAFRLELDSAGNWQLYKKAHWEDDWYKITPKLAAAAEHRRTNRVSKIAVTREGPDD